MFGYSIILVFTSWKIQHGQTSAHILFMHKYQLEAFHTYIKNILYCYRTKKYMTYLQYQNGGKWVFGRTEEFLNYWSADRRIVIKTIPEKSRNLRFLLLRIHILCYMFKYVGFAVWRLNNAMCIIGHIMIKSNRTFSCF